MIILHLIMIILHVQNEEQQGSDNSQPTLVGGMMMMVMVMDVLGTYFGIAYVARVHAQRNV